MKLGEQTPIQDRRKPLTSAVEAIRPPIWLHGSRSPTGQARRKPIVSSRPGHSVDTRQRTNNCFGLHVRAPLENVALVGGGDVFEHEHSAAGLVVARAAEALRDAVAQRSPKWLRKSSSRSTCADPSCLTMNETDPPGVSATTRCTRPLKPYSTPMRVALTTRPSSVLLSHSEERTASPGGIVMPSVSLAVLHHSVNPL